MWGCVCGGVCVLLPRCPVPAGPGPARGSWGAEGAGPAARLPSGRRRRGWSWGGGGGEEMQAPPAGVSPVPPFPWLLLAVCHPPPRESPRRRDALGFRGRLPVSGGRCLRHPQTLSAPWPVPRPRRWREPPALPCCLPAGLRGREGGGSWSGLSSGAAARGGQVTNGGWLG